jgi:hypothetical protein
MRFVFPLALIVGLLATPAMAQTGNGAPSGPHYNLNIIGVENPKKTTLTDSKRHTIFVALGSKGGGPTAGVETRIYLTPGDFEVCDGNGFDAAFDCAGAQIGGGNNGAVFQLPCNTNIDDDQESFLPCDIGETAAYEVWIRALGAPGGGATITTCATDTDGSPGGEICSTENVVLLREKTKPSFRNVTNELTSIVADIDDDGDLERVALFRSELEDWSWQYLNRGLRLAQVRFYLLSL